MGFEVTPRLTDPSLDQMCPSTDSQISSAASMKPRAKSSSSIGSPDPHRRGKHTSPSPRRRQDRRLGLASSLAQASPSRRAGVAEPGLGTIGLAVCADNFGSSPAVAHVPARMGARLILSPSARAVVADHDNTGERSGQRWRAADAELARRDDVTVVGVSNVGPITRGPWAGRLCTGCSLAMGPARVVLGEGPYGENAEPVMCVDVAPRIPVARATGFAAVLQGPGHRGPSQSRPLASHCCGGTTSRITAPRSSLRMSTANFWIACRSGEFTLA